jgi:hypothetical protein
LLPPDNLNPEILRVMLMAAIIELEETKRKNSLYSVLIPFMFTVGLSVGFYIGIS